MDITSYILSKKYVEDSLAGAGALAGKSAYEIAQENGFSGSATEWLASLRGDTPEIGPNGTWVISGVDTGVIASPSLAGYATQEYVNEQIANIDFPETDLSAYATREELNTAILGIIIPDVSGFATKEELDAAIKAIPAPDLTPYATKEELKQAIADIPPVDFTGYATETFVKNEINKIPEVDLTPYATKQEVEDAIGAIKFPETDLTDYATKQDVSDAINAIPEVDLTGLATEDFVREEIGKINIPDLTPYALKSELPDISGLATEEYVAQKIAEAELGEGEVDLSAYYTKSEVDQKIADIEHPTVNLDPYATKEDVANAVAAIPQPDLNGYVTDEELLEAIGGIEIPSTDGLASEEFVREQIAQIEIPDTTGLATEAYVDEAIGNIEHPTVDLTGYATQEYVTQKIAEAELADGDVDLSVYYTKTEVDAKFENLDIPEVDLSNYATKDELPSVEGFASEEYVNNAIANIEIPETKADVNVYEISSDSVVLDELIALLPEGVEINQGDVMLVTNTLGVKSAYQFDETWIACDGNVDASKVIMPFDITLAGSYTQVGNLSKTSTGTATFATKGKSVAAALQEILSKREQPKITSNPSVSLTATNGAKEVGTSITPTWSAKLNAGSYTYGPATGITAASWTISDTEGNTASAASGSFPAITVGDDTNYKITAKASYAAGTIAVDNLGDPSDPTIQIAAGNKSATGSAITGYRAWFMYVGESLDTIDSTFIRGTTNKGATPATQSGVEIPAGTKRVMVAIPASGKNLTSVIDVDGMGLDVFGNFTKTTVDVEGLNGYEAASYNVWVAENANGMAATHYNLVIS